MPPLRPAAIDAMTVPGAVAVALGGCLALVETLAWAAFDWKVALTGASSCSTVTRSNRCRRSIGLQA